MSTTNPLSLQTSAVTQFNTLETQQSNLMYYLDNTDGSGYVFELGEMDVSQAIAEDPSFAALIDEVVGLPDVDAVAQMDVSLVQFQGLFGINIDSEDIDDVSSSDVQFRVNQPQDQTHNDCSNGPGSFQVGSLFDGTTSVAFSGADVKSGHINAAYGPANQTIQFDFVRHLAKQITGGYSSSDIFTNETALRNGVVATDVQLNATLNTVISDVSAVGLQDATYTTGTGSSLIQAAKQLYHLNLQSTDGTGTSSRSDQLLADISLASTNMEGTTAVDGHNEVALTNIDVPLRFHSGDRLAIRLVYKPASTTFPGNGATLTERSYKVLLRLV